MSVPYSMDNEALRVDLEALGADVTLARLQLLDVGAFPAASPLKPSEPVSSEPTKSALSRFTSKFRLKGTRSKKKYAELGDQGVEKPLLPALSLERKSSEETLVGDESLSSQECATFFLSILAPLISTLQRLSPLVVLSKNKDLRVSFMDRCDELSDLLKDVKKEYLFSQMASDDEQEMRMLLFTALHKKVLAEKARALGLGDRSAPLTVTKVDDPFVIHSTSVSTISTLSHRTPSPPKKIAPPVLLKKGEYTDFLGQSQATWRMNVHRLGSFQASALFSPSPVAVRRT